MLFDASQVYQPEADTYLLLEAARAEVRPADRILEVGTGSGLIAATLSAGAGIIATDINPHAVLCAREKGVEVVRTDLFSGIRDTFDLILFNPPYLPTQKDERIDDWLEYALDGGKNGRIIIQRFAENVGRVLAPGGRILLLISSLTGLPEVRDLFFQSGFISEIVLKHGIEDENLYVLRIIRRDDTNLCGDTHKTRMQRGSSPACRLEKIKDRV
jgi:release factor glutamine methyltransferase